MASRIVFLLYTAAIIAGGLVLSGQAYADWHEFNNEALSHHEATISQGRFLLCSSFCNAVMENWQSEYLQFTLYILLTVWFVQNGSPDYKELEYGRTVRKCSQALKPPRRSPHHRNMISRGLAKSGSRDPYFDGGTNEMRDRDGR